MPVPFIGRLNIAEYVAVVGSFLLVGLEAVIRILTLALPSSLLPLFYGASRRLFNRFSSPAQKRAENHKKKVSTKIRNAYDFVDLCAEFGYTAEEHIAQTKDGYLIGLHRLAWRKGEEGMRVNTGTSSNTKRVVYLHHGLLMNSEVWVCLTEAQRCLPFILVEQGFDVWLGNNRGNKYSKKSIHSSPASLQFWNFSIDEFAFHDIPDSIDYILRVTHQPSLSYIGFSQGTAQAFAGLSIHPTLNDRVNVFIALAPAMSPPGLHNGIVDALIKSSPQVLYLLFGRRSILSSATMWQSILYPPIFTKVIDMGLNFLFGWKTLNIKMSQKLAAYPHLYSFTSTKSVVHWFQIIRTKSFQMYDDDVQAPLGFSSSNKYTKVARYPTRNIKTPIVLVYGGSDSLVDIKVMLQELPKQTVATEIPHYEHLDFLWAHDVEQQVFPHVFDALECFTNPNHTEEEYERYRSARQISLSASSSFKRRDPLESDADIAESDISTVLGGNGSTADAGDEIPVGGEAPGLAEIHRQPLVANHKARETLIPTPKSSSGIARPRSRKGLGGDDETSLVSEMDSPQGAVPIGVRFADGEPRQPLTIDPTTVGRWIDGRDPDSPTPHVVRRKGSGASHFSLESRKGVSGISLGASRSVGGVTTAAAEGASFIGGASSDEGGKKETRDKKERKDKKT